MPFKVKSRKPHYDRDYYLKNKERILIRCRAYNTLTQEKRAIRQKEYYLENLDERRAYGRDRERRIKIEVLTHYGPSRTLGCCWPNCSETDIDVLTLDHINNDGAKHRDRISGNGCGKAAYSLVRRTGFPEGFQTLCANHQIKKEIMRRRSHLE